MNISFYKSPIGILEIICKNDALTSLKLVESIKKSDNETALINTIKTQLNEYFLGKRQSFNIKISPQGTNFQKKVWTELLKIPYGTTRSYTDIALNIGNKNSQRAVGSACNKNPIFIIIPCHRVVSKEYGIGGFAYGTNIKEKLLKIETLQSNNFSSYKISPIFEK